MSAPDATAPTPIEPLETSPKGWASTWAQFMFFVATLFLICFGAVLPHQGISSEGIFEQMRQVQWFWPTTFYVLWGVIVVEGLSGVFRAPDGIGGGLRRLLYIALVPPLRIAFSPARPHHYVWVPRQGWMRVSQESSKAVEVKLAIPMLLITLLILPVLVVEFGFSNLPEQYPSLAIVLHGVTALIWFAFALEFILLFGVADKKLAFCKRHWINLAIIILPMIAFLRVMRIFQVGRLMKLGKMLRMYRLKGIQARMLRVIMLFNLIDRFLQEKQPERYLKHLEHRIADRREELAELEERAQQMRQKIADRLAENASAEGAGQEEALADPE